MQSVMDTLAMYVWYMHGNELPGTLLLGLLRFLVSLAWLMRHLARRVASPAWMSTWPWSSSPRSTWMRYLSTVREWGLWTS